MRPDDRLPRKRTASSGSRVPPAVTSTRRPASLPFVSPPREELLDAGRDLRGLGHPPGADEPLRELSVVRPDDDRSALDEQREVRLRRRVLPHRRVHRRRQHERAAMGERGLGQEVVREPVCQPCHRVRGQRRDARTSASVEVRIGVGGRLLPRERPERLGRDELLGAACDDGRDVVPGADEEPDELTCLVGGDAARHADEDSRHGHSVPAESAFDVLYEPGGAYVKVSLPREISSIAIVR